MLGKLRLLALTSCAASVAKIAMMPSDRALSSCAAAEDSRAKTNTPLKNKIVLITGATAGIGKACAWRFAEEGSKLILVGRREDRLVELQKALQQSYKGIRVHLEALDVRDTDKVAKLPEKLPEEFQNVDILVNNAGLALGVTSVENNSVEDAKTMIDTNVLGLIAMCSAFLPGMKTRGSGHVVNMGSIAGHMTYATGSTYNASKYAVAAFTEAARHDLVATPIRITHISPGMVGETEFSNVRLRDDSKAKSVYSNIAALRPEDVADNVIYAVTRPAHVQIADIVMMCTNQSGPGSFIARVGPGLGKAN